MQRQREPLRAVLKIGHFRRLWLGQVSSQLAMNILLFLLGLVLYQNTGSNAAVSGLFLAYGIPSIFFGMVGGAVVDRLDRRAVLILCDVTRAILVLFLYHLSYHVGFIYLIMFVNALINQLYVPAEAPLIPKLVPAALVVSANSLFSFTFYGSMAVGFIAAGPILRLLGPQNSMAAIGLLFAAAAFSVSGIPQQGEGMRSLTKVFRYSLLYIGKRVLSDLLSGIRYVSRSPRLLDALGLLTATQIILVMLGTLGPGFADRILRIDVRDASVFLVGPAVLGIIIGALWVGNTGYRFGPRRLIDTGIVAAGLILLLVSTLVAAANVVGFNFVPRVGSLAAALFLFFLLGVANSFLDVPANSVLQREAEGDMRGRVYGILAAAVGGVGILPVVVGGVLADVIGVGKVIFLLGLTVLGYGLWRIRYNGNLGKGRE